MARVDEEAQTRPPPRRRRSKRFMREHLNCAAACSNYSEYTVKNRHGAHRLLSRVGEERGLAEPIEITRPVLERYQRYLVLLPQEERRTAELPHASTRAWCPCASGSAG